MINLVHVLFYFHLASWPRLVLFTFGPDLFYLLLAPTCFIFSGPDFLFTFAPGLFYFLLAPTCFIVILARASPVLFYQLPGTREASDWLGSPLVN